ncbi:beta-lactamase class A [Spirosoma endophyticum]|uniref:beta-lactamase n=2 Tax=Spirosoma endophyticum TaxID=662367 RepID=A0A1I1YKV1_9BACT|nr:beta-lactamase class A [Spirosoma endophyticum]
MQPKFLYKVGATVPTLFLLLSMTITARGQLLSDSLTTYLHGLPASARVSLSVKSLSDNNVAFKYRADERVPSASVIKLPIMLEAMERVKAGTLNLDKIYFLKASDKVGGSGVLQNYPDQSRVSYRELLRLMMIESDNTATNIFINLLSRDAINQRIRTIGLKQSQLNRIMMDTLAAREGRENYVTAQEMSTLVEKIYRNQVATPKLCLEMIDVLKQVPGPLTISRLLPKGTVVAHKTGTLTYVRGDVGIVYAKEPFLLSVFVEGVPTPEAERIIGELSLICYTYFSHR